MLFEGLTRTSRDGKAELALADRVAVSEDGLRYTFTLRNTKWSNGDPVTSFDFATSWKTVLDPQFPSDIANQLYVIQNGRAVKKGELPINALGIQTPDAKTLVVTLETPVPYFLELVSLTPFLPVPSNLAFESGPWVSNGPFILQNWNRSDFLSFAKNPSYWEASSVQLEEIDFYLTSSDTGIRMFQQGLLDWTGSPLSTIGSAAIPTLRQERLLQVNPFSATSFFRVNTSEAIGEKKNPLSNVHFRKALAAAIDRKSIAEQILQGGHQPATSFVPREMGLHPEGCFADGDATQAMDLLQLAFQEMKEEQLSPIVLSFLGSERNSAIAQAIQNQWEKTLGIQVELDPVEGKVYFQRVAQKEYQLALGSWTADFNDPVNFLEVFKYKESGTNNTGWEDQRYIDLLNRSSVCMDSKERLKCLATAEELLMDQMPLIPIYHYVLNYLANDGLKDVALSSTGVVDFRWAHWGK